MIKQLFVEFSQYIDNEKFVFDVDADPRIRFIYLGHATNSKIVRSINFSSGGLLIGLNEHNRINSLELNIDLKHWKLLADILLEPQLVNKTSVEFVNVNSRLNEFNKLPLNVFTNKEQSAVKIEIGKHDKSNSLWVRISENCLAEITDNYLTGFWIDISMQRVYSK